MHRSSHCGGTGTDRHRPETEINEGHTSSRILAACRCRRSTEALSTACTCLVESGRVRGTQSPGLKPRTVRYIHTIIHAALDDAVRWRRVPVNAANQATPPSSKVAKAPEMNVWSGPELATFLELTAGARHHFPWMFLPSPDAAEARRSGCVGGTSTFSVLPHRSASRWSR